MSFIFNYDIITCIILAIGLYYMFRKGPKQKKDSEENLHNIEYKEDTTN